MSLINLDAVKWFDNLEESKQRELVKERYPLMPFENLNDLEKGFIYNFNSAIKEKYETYSL